MNRANWLLATTCAAALLWGQTGDGLTPLHKAVSEDDAVAVKRLLAAGADARAATTLGHVTPLALAALRLALASTRPPPGASITPIAAADRRRRPIGKHSMRQAYAAP